MKTTLTYTGVMKVFMLVIVALVLVAILPEVRKSKSPVFTASTPVSTSVPVQTPIEVSDSNPADMLPWRSERLPTLIALPNCKGVKIIEWRPSKGLEPTSGPSDQAIAVVDDICVQARMNFAKFIRMKQMVGFSIDGFHQDVCLMPADIHRDGNQARNLNDVRFRFQNRTKEYTSDGRLYTIWGYTEYSSGTIFMWNKVLNDDGSKNKKFAEIFSHEMFHAMSKYSKLYLNYQGLVAPQDEKMAQEFTKYLGYI